MTGRTFQRFILAVLPCLLITACVQYRVEDVPFKPSFDHSFIKKIAVVEFSNYTGEHGAGRIIADHIEQQILSESSYEVITRMQLNHILREHQLSLKGFLSPSTVRRIGKVAGVDAIVVGNVEKYQITAKSWVKRFSSGFKTLMHKKEALVVFTFKVLNTTTGEVVFAKSARGTSWLEANDEHRDSLEKYSDYEFMEIARKNALLNIKEIYPHNQKLRVRVK